MIINIYNIDYILNQMVSKIEIYKNNYKKIFY